MADLKTTAEERASLRELLRGDASSVRAWRVAEGACHDVDALLAENAKLREVAEAAREYRAISARLRAAEAEVERLRGLVRWFLDGDDHTHEDDCSARGGHDNDVCRNEASQCHNMCEGPHCACGATEMRARARAALGEP